MSIQCELAALQRDLPDAFDRPLAILIPAYNEARHLPRVIAACRAVRPEVVMVIDDCSTDETPQVLCREAGVDENGVRVVTLRNPYNLGKQGTVRRGLRLLSPCPGLEAVAMIDGDGQHDPRQLPRLAASLDRYHCVIGARSREQMPLQRRLSNWLVDSCFSLICGVSFADVQSGLRIYRKDLADVLGRNLPASGGFVLEHESLAVLARHAAGRGRNLRFAAAHISCAYGDEQSSLGPASVAQLAFETVRQAARIRAARHARGAEKNLRAQRGAAPLEVC